MLSVDNNNFVCDNFGKYHAPTYYADGNLHCRAVFENIQAKRREVFGDKI